MSSYRSIVSSPLGVLSEAEQDHPLPSTRSIRSSEAGVSASSEGGQVEDTFVQKMSILVDQPVGSMSISEPSLRASPAWEAPARLSS